MNLIPRNSLFDFDNLFDVFRSPLATTGRSAGAALSPRVDVTEKKDRYVITAELPGIDKKDIEVSLEQGILSISAETRQEHKEEKDGKVIRQERHYGRFVRSFNVGDGVQEKEIKANFKDGLLTLEVPRKEEPVPASRRIEIH